MNDLQKHVEQIAQDLSNPNQLEVWATEYEQEDYSVIDYLEGVLDIEYVVGSDGEYRGARVLVAFGGPTIWINTRTNTVEGGWWEESARAHFDDEIGLNETLEELFNCK